MSYIDIIFIGIVIVNGFIAYSRGLIKTVFNFLSTIVALIITYLFSPTVSEFIRKNTGLYQILKQKIGQSLNIEGFVNQAVTPQEQIGVIQNLEIPDFMKEVLLRNNNTEIHHLLDVSGLGDYVSSMIATMIINALSFVLVFVIAIIVLNILANVLDLIAKLPIIRQANKLAGLIIGIVWGFVLNWVVCLIIYAIAGFQQDGNLLQIIGESPVASFFYNNNILIDFVTDVTKTLI